MNLTSVTSRISSSAKCLSAAFLFFTASLSGQNTYDGVVRRIPEAELKTQAAFIDAERERLLAHFPAAIEKYKTFLYNEDQNGAAWYGLARCYQAQKEYGLAAEAVAKAVAAEPENEWYSVLQADIFEQNVRYKDAVNVYTGLVKRFPKNTAFYERLAYLQTLAEDPKAALKTLEKLESITGITEATSDKKHILYVAMGDDKKAAQELLKLADAKPDKLEYRHRLARFYENMGDAASARKVYEDILRRRPDDSAARLALAGGNKAKSGEVQRVESMQALFADPKVTLDDKVKEIMPYLVKIQNGQAEPALLQALLPLGDAVEKAHPAEAKAWSLSGDLYYLAGRNDEALPRYQQCLKLRSNVFSVWKNTLEILLGKGKFAEALPLAEQALDNFPNQPYAYYYYGVAATNSGKANDAIVQLEQALLMSGKDPLLTGMVSDQIGLAFIAKKDYDGAIKRYEAALAKGQDKNPLLLKHLGDAYNLKGDKAKAEEYWKKAN